MAVPMYAMDFKGTLPGPVHFLLYHDTWKHWVESGNSGGEAWYRQQLPYLLAKYMGAKGARNVLQISDQVSTCPSAERIPRADGKGQSWIYQPQADYIINSGADADSNPDRRYNNFNLGPPIYPLYITGPESYFGWVHFTNNIQAHITNNIEPLYKLPIRQRNYLSVSGRLSRKIEKVKRTSQEWMVSDLWYAQVKHGRYPDQVAGPWPFDITAGVSGSVVNNGQLRIPGFAFHYTTKTYGTEVPSAVPFEHPRLDRGKTNNVFFDGHAAAVRHWMGTANPRRCTDINSLPASEATGDKNVPASWTKECNTD